MSFSSSIKKILTYTITNNVIGRGSYSKVYLGYTFNNEKCAIKLISSIGLNTSIRDKLLDEAHILKQLNHPNIIKLYDIYEELGDIYIIMEYCEKTMLALLDEKLNETSVKYYIKQLVDGLYYLQKKNIVHRDIKPANILLKNNIIKIADFGFAKALDNNDIMMDTICGSPLYMAPEILYKAKYSSKSDLWSLGIIIYQMIYRKHPYKNPKSIIDLIRKIESDDIIFEQFIDNIKISEECINLMKELLDISPTSRISLCELRNDIWFVDVNLPLDVNNFNTCNNDLTKSFEYMFGQESDEMSKKRYSIDIDSLDNNMNSDIIIDNFLENINIKTKPINIVSNKTTLKCNVKNEKSNKEVDLNNKNSFGSMGNGIGSSFLSIFGLKKL